VPILVIRSPVDIKMGLYIDEYQVIINKSESHLYRMRTLSINN